MNVILHIKEFNAAERRPASRSVDLQDQKRAFRWGRFVSGAAFLLVWSLFWSFVIFGWGAM